MPSRPLLEERERLRARAVGVLHGVLRVHLVQHGPREVAAWRRAGHETCHDAGHRLQSPRQMMRGHAHRPLLRRRNLLPVRVAELLKRRHGVPGLSLETVRPVPLSSLPWISSSSYLYVERGRTKSTLGRRIGNEGGRAWGAVARRSRGPGSIFMRARPPIGYHSGAIVTAWPTTWRSRQHSARRLSRRYDVLPPCRYIKSIASRAQSAA